MGLGGNPARSRPQLEAIFEFASEMFSYYDTDLRVRWANRAYIETLGLRGQHIIDRRCYELLHGRSSPCEDCAVQLALKTGRPQGMEAMASDTADGKNWLLREYPVLDSCGRITGVLEMGLDITARKRSQEEFHTLFEHSPTSLWIEDFSAIKSYLREATRREKTDVRSYLRANPEALMQCVRSIEVLEVNRASVELHNAASKDVLMANLGRIVRPETFAQLSEEIARLYEGQTSFQMEAINRKLTGEWMDMLLRVAVMPGHEEALDKVLVELSDITDRKKAEKALRDSEEQLRLITDNLPVLIAYLDSGFRFRFVNRTYEQWFCLPADKIVGVLLVELLGEPRFRSIAPNLEKALAGEAVSFDGEFSYPDGRHRSIRTTMLPHTRKDGQVEGFFSLVEDITERKLFEESLRESSQFSQQIISSARDGIAVLDRELRYMVWNPYMEELTGIKAAEVLGKPVQELFPFLEEVGAYEGLQKALAGQSNSTPEFMFRQRWCAPIQAPLRNARGEIVGVIAIIRDTTERKMAEDRRQKLEEELFQAQKMESVGRLAGGIAHDFNNLLTSIIGNAELALGSSSPEAPESSGIRDILKAADRASVLIRQLLAFSRKQTLEPKVIDLNTLIRDMDKMLRRLIGETVELQTSLAAGLHPVRIDPGRMEQVLTNLVVNARDAIAHGGSITIRTENAILDAEYTKQHPGAAPGEYVLMSVIDTGTGMEESVKSHLFEPFFTTKEKGKGTGLGLSTCYGIVHLHHGHISISSEVGTGTTVRVYLPAASIPAQALPAPEAKPASQGKETILVAEDEEAVRKVVRWALAVSGFTVLEAANGKEALEVAENCGRPIDLLLTDVVMPIMGGRELAETLRRRLPDLRILFMSGYSDDALLYQEIQGTSVIEKPFSSATLCRSVREALDRRRPPGRDPPG